MADGCLFSEALQFLRRGRKSSLCLRVCAAFSTILPHATRAENSSSKSNLEWNNDWSSPYSRGLGGSQTAHAINEDAIFANPAGLVRTRNPRSRNVVDVFEIPKISFGGNRTMSNALRGKGLQPSVWLKEMATSSTNQRAYMEVQVLPWLVTGEKQGPTYFLGFPIRSTFLASPSTDDGVTRTIATQTTATAALSAVISSRTGALSMGLTVRPNMRWNSSNTLSLSDISNSKGLISDFKQGAYKTTSTAMDFGINLMARDFWLPTFGLSVLNLPTGCVDNYLNPATGKTQSVCGAKRSGEVQESIDATRIDPTEIRAGLSIIPRVKFGRNRINVKISGDVYPLPIQSGSKKYGLHDVNINQITHAGVEIYTGNAMSSRNFSIRAGLNDTRTSMGISIPMPHFTFEATTYEAALFTQGKATKERRYLIGLSSDW